MKRTMSEAIMTRLLFSIAAIAVSLAFLANAHSVTVAAPVATNGVEKKPQLKSFSSPRAAADALIQAASKYDVPTLLGILGPQAEDMFTSKDPTLDKVRARQFAEKARVKSSIKLNPKNSSQATLVVGTEEWPLPIPIIKEKGKWQFDSATGHQEVLNRRIGENELDAIAVCRGYVEAQLEYASQIHDGRTPNQYAQRIVSSPGKRDGLAWKNPDGSWGGPVGYAVAKALEEGYSKQGSPFHGYFFKILKAQGPSAPLGALDYVINGAMIGGFALVAWPADYRVTGVKTFIVGFDGIVYQKDLGINTQRIAAEMQVYDPDQSWKQTNDDWKLSGL
jgi:hypothetical protein